MKFGRKPILTPHQQKEARQRIAAGETQRSVACSYNVSQVRFRGFSRERLGMAHQTEDVAGKKVAVKGGGVCIYCGWDGGEKGLGNEHSVPYSLGGNTELLNASCSDCEAITSYLDGYMANAIFGHLRVHINLQSRSGHPTTLPATIELADGQRAVELATGDHPFF